MKTKSLTVLEVGKTKANCKPDDLGIDLLSSQFNVEWKCTLDGAHCSENFEIQVDLPEGQGGPHELSLEVGGQNWCHLQCGWTMKNRKLQL